MCRQDVRDNLLHAHAVFDLREHNRPFGAHGFGVARHHGKVGADGRGEVGLVDDQQIGLRDPRPALAGDFIAAGHVDDVNRKIRQFAAEMRRQIVASRFQEQKARVMLLHQMLQRQNVGRDILADRRMGTATGFDRLDSIRRQRLVANQEFAVLARENVVGDGAQVDPVAQTGPPMPTVKAR
jgi:hypothetical protein